MTRTRKSQTTIGQALSNIIDMAARYPGPATSEAGVKARILRRRLADHLHASADPMLDEAITQLNDEYKAHRTLSAEINMALDEIIDEERANNPALAPATYLNLVGED